MVRQNIIRFRVARTRVLFANPPYKSNHTSMFGIDPQNPYVLFRTRILSVRLNIPQDQNSKAPSELTMLFLFMNFVRFFSPHLVGFRWSKKGPKTFLFPSNHRVRRRGRTWTRFLRKVFFLVCFSPCVSLYKYLGWYN